MALTPLVPQGKRKYVGEAILIIGGGSSVGQFVIQLAKASGFSQIITTASSKHTKKLKELGATHIIDRTIPLDTIQTNLAEIIGSQGGGIKYVFDAISEPETQKAAFDLLSPGGKLEIVLPPQVPIDSEERKVTLTFGSADAPHNRARVKTLFSGVGALIEEGTLKPCDVEVVPGGLGAIVGALKRLENNEVSGVKLVVRPSDQ